MWLERVKVNLAVHTSKWPEVKCSWTPATSKAQMREVVRRWCDGDCWRFRRDMPSCHSAHWEDECSDISHEWQSRRILRQPVKHLQYLQCKQPHAQARHAPSVQIS
jgi:hypothetical protein